MYSRDRLIKAIDNSACLTRRQIDDYLQNKLFPEELYVVEMHLNECPFCNDAVEGYTKSGNANQLLSTVEEFSFTAIPTQEAKPEPVPAAKIAETKTPEKKAPAPPAPEKLKEVKKAPPAEPVKKVVFDKEPGRSRRLVPIGIAAAVVLGLGIWGITKMGSDKDPNTMLADNSNAAAGALTEDGMFNESSINRQEDSAMNAKYGFQNQQPMSASHYSARQSSQTGAGQLSDSSSSIAMAGDVVTEQAASPAVARADERSGRFVGPVQPREEEQRKVASAPASADRAKTTTVAAAPAKAKTPEPVKADKTIAANSKDAKNKTATPAAAPANARTAATKETPKPAENKAAPSQALTQADKDYKKGLELYNKKQYSASIMYFQSAAKVKDYPNRTKAESYIKLAKSEVVNAERKKNSEKNNDK